MLGLASTISSRYCRGVKGLLAQDRGSPQRIAELIERLGRLVRAQSHAADLNPAQWEALRYLARCNRFSNTAGAFAAYLGATKGTVSQTLNALERKGLILRKADPASRRVVRLSLTRAGRALLASDPLLRFSEAAAALAPQTRAYAEAALSELLAALQRQNGLRPFGACRTCRFFRRDAAGKGAHFCALLSQPLSEEDSAGLCSEHALAA